MSRYFQSSYHGSNDYRKYREERLGKNIDIPIPNQKKSFTQDFSYRPQSRRNIVKESLQSFGKQFNQEQTKMHNQYEDFNMSDRQTDRHKKQETFKYEGSSFLSKKEFNNEFDKKTTQENKLSRYMKDTFKEDKRPSIFNQKFQANTINTRQPYQSSRGNSRPLERYSRSKQNLNDYEPPEQFEDSIITRRRKYDNMKEFTSQVSYLESQPKTYNYSNKLKNISIQLLDSKPFQSKQLGNIRETKFQQKYKTGSDLQQHTPSTSPYRSRNQMIKQRLKISQNRQEEVPFRSIKRQFDPIDEPLQIFSTKRQFIPSQIKTTHVTPEKSLLTPRQDKNASQKRRKSLIQKSQMLKEKLNKLNASSNTKAVQNQETQLRPKANQKQNILQNYTPKRHLTNSFRVNNEDSEKVDRSVSKKLNFEEPVSRAEPFKSFDKNITENRQSSKNYYSTSVTASGINGPHCTETTGEGALRKISELNERINSRLESILQNYG